MRSVNKNYSLSSIYFPFAALIFFLFSCSPSSAKKTSKKFDQYYIQGEILYQQHCSNCHQKNGKGLGLVYPPLDSSDYMQQNFKEVVCLIRNGKSGELIVNGKSFNQQMKGITTLSDLEIAEITTYLYNTWSNSKGLVDVKEIEAILNTCSTK